MMEKQLNYAGAGIKEDKNYLTRSVCIEYSPSLLLVLDDKDVTVLSIGRISFPGEFRVSF